MVWGEKTYEDPNGDAYIVKNDKSKKALNAYYTANVGANTVNTLDVQNRKNSIFKLLSTLKSSDIVKAMRFDDMESSYSGLKEPNGKHVHDSLAIMFSGAYDHGKAPFPEESIPYTLSRENLIYVATMKENWCAHFPTVVMMQRNTSILKSLLERFLRSNTKRVTTSSSSSSSAAPAYITPNFKSEEEIFNDCNLAEFTSYTTTTDNTLALANQLSLSHHQNTASMNEYALDCKTCSHLGHAVIRQFDGTLIDIEFDIALTVRENRRFCGEIGTHEWVIYKPIEKPGEFSIHVKESVIVLGIHRNKVHIQDPNQIGIAGRIAKSQTFLIPVENFICDDITLTPESL